LSALNLKLFFVKPKKIIQIGNIEEGLVRSKEAVAMDTTDGLSWSILGKTKQTNKTNKQNKQKQNKTKFRVGSVNLPLNFDLLLCFGSATINSLCCICTPVPVLLFFMASGVVFKPSP
jgi:hypothetical protein